jgi:hypothetical protein
MNEKNQNQPASDSAYGTHRLASESRTSGGRTSGILRVVCGPSADAGHRTRAAAIATSAADIGAYFVLSQGRAAARPPTISVRVHRISPAPTIRVKASATASAAGISG